MEGIHTVRCRVHPEISDACTAETLCTDPALRAPVLQDKKQTAYSVPKPSWMPEISFKAKEYGDARDTGTPLRNQSLRM